MYSGTTLTPMSGRIVGAHQKIDKLARRILGARLNDDKAFPGIKPILHFEGINGPDAIKRKSPAQDEPWHYLSPFDVKDTKLTDLIEAHYDRLIVALKAKDDVRAAFEASWLAHALVDGLTPAHHFPYEEALTALRGGAGIETRTTIKEKLVLPGETRREQVRNNWKMWGPRGLMSTHGFFEWGVAALIAPLSSRSLALTDKDISELYEHGIIELFRRKAKEVSSLGMFDAYYEHGWTPKLAKQVRNHLVPTIVKTVALAWYAATIDAGLTEKQQ
ncbi:MAG TPA: hypothetical protein VD735_06915 [Candidatus Saccharimonadales bacterium]|nr:hypothetical protein [Candidatus Saccharimonadales bacterium]